MSEWYVVVSRLENVRKHPNADTLSIADINGTYPVIFKTGEYREGQLAVYVPVDSIVPVDDLRWSFLGGDTRIRAKKLRGVFSMGLITEADPSWEEGQIVADELKITKYDPDSAREKSRPKPKCGGILKHVSENEPDPGLIPKYDIEGLRKYPNLFKEGELVWISEKIHGQNARYIHDGKRLWVASRNLFKRRSADFTWGEFTKRKWRRELADVSWSTFIKQKLSTPVPTCTWWQVANRYDLERKLATCPGIAIYGETYGNNRDMSYGVRQHGTELAQECDRFVMFDAYDTISGWWFDCTQLRILARRLDLPLVPTLYEGPWNSELANLSEGNTTLGDAKHVREGIVIKPLVERHDPRFGRVMLKLAGQGYLLQKDA